MCAGNTKCKACSEYGENWKPEPAPKDFQSVKEWAEKNGFKAVPIAYKSKREGYNSSKVADIGAAEVQFPTQQLQGAAGAVGVMFISEAFLSKTPTFGTFTRAASMATSGLGFILFSPGKAGKAFGITLAGCSLVPIALKATGKSIAGLQVVKASKAMLSRIRGIRIIPNRVNGTETVPETEPAYLPYVGGITLSRQKVRLGTSF